MLVYQRVDKNMSFSLDLIVGFPSTLDYLNV